MERGFEDAFKNIQTQAPKDLVKEYQTPGGGKENTDLSYMVIQ